jgi:hypothetical protein
VEFVSSLPMEPDDTFIRSDSPLTAEVDGEVVMLEPATSTYFGLEGVGGRIWELCAEPQSLRSLVATLTDEFDVDEATCRAEVGSFVDALVDANLLVPRHG